MCGIAGCVLSPGETPSPERLGAMRDALKHRGPDGSGIEVFENVGLVHTRLAIVDLSERAHQPMRHPTRPWWLSFNGEIYNHKAIRRDLHDSSFTSDSDTETLLHALARWGPGTLDRLNGQFAFACLDIERRRVLLARDRFGIKPLYLVEAKDGIWFASEPQALFASGIEPSPRPHSWPTLVDSACYRGELTLVEGVRRLEPGTFAEISLDAPSFLIKRWSSVAGHVGPEEQRRLQASGRAALVSELDDVLRSAVHDALLADVPVGTMCSGGVDSSLITAFASEVKRDLVAFGASYKGGPGPDEGPAAQKVADSLGIEADLFEVTKPGWRSGFVTATLHFGAPLRNASSVTIAQMAERARRRGIKVLLTGEGADELFGGYLNHRQAPLAGFLSVQQRLAREMQAAVSRRPSELARDVQRRARWLAAGRPNPGWYRSALVRSYTHEPDSDQPSSDEIGDAYVQHFGSRRSIETQLVRRLDWTLSWLLNRMDKNMMQVSVEARVPFLDPRLVTFVLNLPLEARVLPWNKGILRDVACRHLPLRIAHRRKIQGMFYDAGKWIDEGADPSFLSEGVFKDAFQLSDKEFSVLLSTANHSDRMRLWSAEVWCRSVFAGEAPEAIEKELWPQGP
jgi:asparagine synthase (glutamine-hydrolysing)